MKEDIFDYVVLMNNTPSFESNNEIIAANITGSGGTSPTITGKAMKPMVGGKSDSGRMMLHFRLNQRLNETEVIDFLNQGTELPRSPISVESIRSAFKIIPVESGEDITYEYETLVPAIKDNFLPYLVEQTDEDGNPNGTFNDFLSCYFGTDPIMLDDGGGGEMVLDIDEDGLGDTMAHQPGGITITEGADSINIDVNGDGKADIILPTQL